MIIYLISLIYLFVATFIKDPFTYNYSMMSGDFYGYLFVMGLSIVLGLSLYKTSIILKKKSILCLLAPLVASIFPYVEGRGDFFSNMHEIFAYMSLGLILYVTYINIINYRFFSLKKSAYCLKILGITIFIDTIYYFDSFRVYSIHELILLSVIILIHLFIYYDVKKQN